jgi:glycosyltransferase involved in cell wall biosynthesis
LTPLPEPAGAAARTGELAGLSVCVVACHYRPESTGSAPYNSMLVDTLVDAGADVEVVTGIPHYPQWTVQDAKYRRGLRWRENDAGARLVRVRHAVPAKPNLFGRMGQESSFAAMSAPYVAASRAQVIVAVTPLVGAMTAAHAGRRGRPLGVIVHDLSGNAAVQSGTAGGRAGRLVAGVEYGMLRRADRVGVITQRLIPDLTSHGVAPARITELPISARVTPTDLPPDQARRRLGWEETGLVVIHTGNMGMKQGLEHVVSAARLAQDAAMDVRFVFVGDGNQRADLQAAAQDLDNMRFTGLVSDDDYPLVLAAADVLLLHERPGVLQMSLPSKLTSYAAARRPILAAVDDGGITKALLKSYGAALTTPSGDAQALVSSLRTLSQDRELSAAIVAGAQDMAAAEFSDVRSRAAFRDFVRALAD